ncbi:hypothetical protein Q8A67_025569 [Cirrhinus molitorella]|uniref:Uncharacterized protein n=1 Tax=Cirrhinus molitorella TaxID=172907 RepID=A0AA88NUU1_9TELE|nr:hypothetical protein Q8A67_025569 [Cirrhinus molitorella]
MRGKAFVIQTICDFSTQMAQDKRAGCLRTHMGIKTSPSRDVEGHRESQRVERNFEERNTGSTQVSPSLSFPLTCIAVLAAPLAPSPTFQPQQELLSVKYVRYANNPRLPDIQVIDGIFIKVRRNSSRPGILNTPDSLFHLDKGLCTNTVCPTITVLSLKLRSGPDGAL